MHRCSQCKTNCNCGFSKYECYLCSDCRHLEEYYQEQEEKREEKVNQQIQEDQERLRGL